VLKIRKEKGFDMKFDSLYHGKKTLRTTIIALLIVGAFLLPAVAEINKVGTYFWIDPERNIYGDPGGAFSIAIKIANAPTTYAWGLKLSYNTTVLNVTGASEGDWLSGAGSTSFFSTPLATANAQGYIVIEDTLIGASAGASNNGRLCNVTFQILAVGRSDLNLYDTFLLDLNLVKTDYPNNDGYFCANDAFPGLHDVYVVSVTAEEEVQQGELVNITVTIHNEGDVTQLVNVTITATTALYPDITVWQSSSPYSLVHCVPEVIGPIQWDTTLVAGEKWILRTEVIKVDAVDDDPHDNVYIGPEVLVRSQHDIKVTDVTILTPKVHKGDIAKVKVTVHNEGKVPEDVRVILFAENPDKLLYFTGPGVLTVCEYYTWLDPKGPPPEICTWWHIIEALDAPELVSKEFHVDAFTGDTFHMDFIWPHYPEPLSGVVIAEQEIIVNEANVLLEPCVPLTITFDWNTSLFDPKDYVIAALAYPVEGEEQKNWLDNKIKDPENTITVTYSDMAMVSVKMLDATTCYYGGFHPVAVPEITLANLGLEPMKVIVYFLADPDMPPNPDGDEIVFGVAVIGPLAPGAVQTFRGCSPFGGWDRRLPSISLPPNVGVPGTPYSIVASLYPVSSLGYRDDDATNNANAQVPWVLPVVNHDVTIDITAQLLPNIQLRDWVYLSNSLRIEVTVTNQMNVTETFDLTLKNVTTGIIGTVTGVSLGGLASETVTFKLNTTAAALLKCHWYTLYLEANVSIAVDDDPCDNVQSSFATFYVNIMGDVNNDNKVGAPDIIKVGDALFSLPGDPNYNVRADVNDDNKVGAPDIIKIGDHLFEPCS